MVRLKGVMPSNFIKERDIFQFQNGAIKRGKFIVIKADKIIFQFQNGAIKSYSLLAVFLLRLQFQFQNGAIKRRWFRHKPGQWFYISIPEWCD